MTKTFILVLTIGAAMSMAQGSDDQILKSVDAERLRGLVEAKMEVFDKYHSPEYQLISPVGMPFTFETYREAIRTGKLHYLVFEPDSPVVVRVRGNTAILRYEAKLEFAWDGQKQKPVRLWHTDYYEKEDGVWRAVWSQATQIWYEQRGPNQALEPTATAVTPAAAQPSRQP